MTEQVEPHSMNEWASWDRLTSMPWSVYVTCTFPDDTSEERASKLWSVFMMKLARAVLPCQKARCSGLPWVRGVEKHSNGSSHVHALIGDVDEVSSATMSSLWKDLTSGGIIDIQTHDKSRDALSYVTKSGNVDVSRRYFES